MGMEGGVSGGCTPLPSRLRGFWNPVIFFFCSSAGEEEKLLKIRILEDSQPEGDESIFVVLTSVQLLQGDPDAGM